MTRLCHGRGWLWFLAVLPAAVSLAADVKTHTELAAAPRHEYRVTLGGTIDGAMTRTPIGYGVWSQEFEPNVSVRLENLGDTDVVNPWLLVNGRRNWRTVQDIVAAATTGCTTEREKAIGIWQFEIAHRFHFTTLDAENVDPVKVFNIYGFTLCGDDAQVISDLWRTAGLKVRRGFPQGHCTAEAFYDGRFHLLDGDEQIICLLRDNTTIGSEADVVRDHDLMKRTHTYGVLSGDDRGTDEFSASLCVYEGHREGEHGPHIGHTMHFTLRPGEALEWRWDNVGKLHNPGGFPTGKEILARTCNGRMHYTPRLPGAAQQSGAVVNICSPYVIVGAVVNGTFLRPAEQDACKLAFSFDQKTWKTVYEAGLGEKPAQVDLVGEFPVTGPARYSYFLRLESAGNGSVKDLAIQSVLQMAPLSLPALELGENAVVYVSDTPGPQNVRITHSWQESSATRPPAAPAKPLCPENGGAVAGTQFTFAWEVPVDPDGDAISDYHFQLSDRQDMRWFLSPNFNRLVSRTPDKGKAQYTVPYKGLLNPGQAYYWRVRARDAKGAWSAWSQTWSFTPQAPGIPLNVRCRNDLDKNTVTLTWSANPNGAPPGRYRVYGSDEKGFGVSDTPYRILWRSIQQQAGLQGPFSREMRDLPANFATEATATSLVIAGPDLAFPNANKAYYRVVAVDANGVESGPSDYAAVRRPFIWTRPPVECAVGVAWEYRASAVASLGDLRSRTFVDNQYLYNAGFWDQDEVHYRLFGAPAWLTIDEQTGVMRGTPAEKDVGKSAFMVYADISKVDCISQAIRLEVKPK